MKDEIFQIIQQWFEDNGAHIAHHPDFGPGTHLVIGRFDLGDLAQVVADHVEKKE